MMIFPLLQGLGRPPGPIYVDRSKQAFPEKGKRTTPSKRITTWKSRWIDEDDTTFISPKKTWTKKHWTHFSQEKPSSWRHKVVIKDGQILGVPSIPKDASLIFLHELHDHLFLLLWLGELPVYGVIHFISSLALPWSISIISNKGPKTHNSTDASHWNSTQNTTPEFIEAIGMYSILRPHRARLLLEKHACRDANIFSSRCWVYSYFFCEDFHSSCASKKIVRFLSVDDNDAKKIHSLRLR